MLPTLGMRHRSLAIDQLSRVPVRMTSPLPTADASAPLPAQAPAHLYALDVLRGFGALAVVFWHWQHFFLDATGAHVPGFAVARQPLYALFAPLYAEGYRAVELFFCLSGFIFTWLYADPIWRRTTTPRTFAVLRLSRLYPLHLATLLFVAAAQAAMVRAAGAPFVYRYNDAYHFALQSAFAGNWGLERGDSFNGPTWSVSVEILLYALFFLTCRLGVRRWWQLAGVAAAGFALIEATVATNYGIARVGQGIFCFYVGGVAFRGYQALQRRGPTPRMLAGLAALAAALWVVVPPNVDTPFQWWHQRLAGTAYAVAGHDPVSAVLYRLGHYGFELLVYPLTIVTLALWESARGPLGRKLRWLGDVSYASYLLHFPLELVVVGAARRFNLPRAVFYRSDVLLGFFALLVPLSLVVYRQFELPAQRRLRARLLGRAAARGGAVGVPRGRAGAGA